MHERMTARMLPHVWLGRKPTPCTGVGPLPSSTRPYTYPKPGRSDGSSLWGCAVSFGGKTWTPDLYGSSTGHEPLPIFTGRSQITPRTTGSGIPSAQRRTSETAPRCTAGSNIGYVRTSTTVGRGRNVRPWDDHKSHDSNTVRRGTQTRPHLPCLPRGWALGSGVDWTGTYPMITDGPTRSLVLTPTRRRHEFIHARTTTTAGRGIWHCQG